MRSFEEFQANPTLPGLQTAQSTPVDQMLAEEQPKQGRSFAEFQANPTLPGLDQQSTEHIVEPGDTLSAIAQKNNVRVEDISGYSSGDPDLIRPGEKLTIKPQIDATAQALQAGADPQTLAWAKQHLGKKEYIGFCQQFARTAAGEGWQGSNAISAWENNAERAVQGLEGIEPGDLVYFSANPSNNYDGHVGVYAGDNQFISATYNGVEEYPLNAWQEQTGQQVLGYIPMGRGTKVVE